MNKAPRAPGWLPRCRLTSSFFWSSGMSLRARGNQCYLLTSANLLHFRPTTLRLIRTTLRL